MKSLSDKVADLAVHILYKKETTSYFWSVREKALDSKSILVRFWNQYRYTKLIQSHNAYIPLHTKIKGKPVFPHGVYGVFISSSAEIGKGCVIFHQVTIGSNTLAGSKRNGAPVIGDNVYIGCGAKIIGAVRIGNNVRIGANCVVTKDIPDNSTVVLSEPRLIVREGAPDNGYVEMQKFRSEKTT